MTWLVPGSQRAKDKLSGVKALLHFDSKEIRVVGGHKWNMLILKENAEERASAFKVTAED